MVESRERLVLEKAGAYRNLLRMLSDREIDAETYHELVDLVKKARSVEEINAVFERIQVSPF